MTADDDNAPYIDVIDGVTAHSDFNSSNNIKARLGKMDGINDSTFGTLSGYGLYSQNVYLTGGIKATFGEIGGFGISATTLSSSDETFVVDSANKSIRLGNNATDITLASSSGVFMSGSGEFRVGNPDSDQFKFSNGNLEITASQINLSGSGVGISTATFELDSDGLDISATSKSIDLGDGKIILSGSTIPVMKIDGGQISASNFFVSETGEMTASAGKIASWTINESNLTSIDSDGGISIDAGNKIITVRTGSSSDNSTIRLRMGEISANQYGLQGEDDDGNYIFNLGQQGNNIAGWTFDNETLSGGTLRLNSSGNGYFEVGGLSGVDEEGTTKTGSFFGGTGKVLMKAGNTANSNYIKLKNGELKLHSTNVDISGSNVNVQTPSFFLGSATSYVSGSTTGVKIASTEFNLNANNGDLALSSTEKSMSLGDGKIKLVGSTNPLISMGRNVGEDQIKFESDSSNTLLFKFNKPNYSSNTSGVYQELLSDGQFRFNLGDGTNYIKFDTDASNTIDIRTDKAHLTGNSVTITTPNFFFGTAGTAYISSSNNTLAISSSKFHLDGGTAIFGGDLSAAGGTFSGNLSAAGGTFSGNLSAVGGDFSGSVSASEGNIGGWTIGADSLTGGNATISSSGVISWAFTSCT